ncbi:MAG: sulfatase-like hydrolase/transferase [Bdellovibrionales bacterium]
MKVLRRDRFIFPALFVSLFLLTEVIQTVKLISGQVVAEDALRLSLLAWPQFVSFGLRVCLLFALLFVVLWMIEEIFLLFHRAWFYLGLLLYVFLFNLVRNPSIFDEFESFRATLLTVQPWLGEGMVHLAAVSCLGAAWVSLLRSHPRKLRVLWASILTMLLVSFYWLGQRLGPLPQRTAALPPISSEGKNVIILSVDSLLPHEDLSLLASGPDDPVARFWRQSISFDRVITPLPRTHASLVSLFTARTPSQHGVRYNLSSQSLDTDKLLEDSPLSRLKNAGFEVSYLNDENDYTSFAKGQVIDHVGGGAQGLKALFFPSVFRSRLIAGLFNNPVGYFFLPEMRANAAFATFYRPEFFRTEILNRLSYLQNEKRPFFLFAHSNFLHWPGHLTYPDYPRQGFAKGGSPYSYDTSVLWGQTETYPAERMSFDREIYRRGVAAMTRDHLRPLLQALYDSGEMERSIVVLMSDHGENFWSADRLPKARYPEHGSTLLLGDPSEQMFLRIHFPKEEARHISSTVGIIDVLPTILESLGLKDFKYEGESFLPLVRGGTRGRRDYFVETGYWPWSLFEGQFTAYSAGTLFSNLITGPREQPYLSDSVTAPVMIQKQFALYRESFKLVMYPSREGYRLFLCDLENDESCKFDVARLHPKTLSEMATQIVDQLASEQVRGWIPPLRVVQRRGSVEIISEPTRRGPITDWARLLSASEAIHRHHEFQVGLAILTDLTQAMDRSVALKANDELKSICRSRVLADSLSQKFCPQPGTGDVEVRPLRTVSTQALIQEWLKFVVNGQWTKAQANALAEPVLGMAWRLRLPGELDQLWTDFASELRSIDSPQELLVKSNLLVEEDLPLEAFYEILKQIGRATDPESQLPLPEEIHQIVKASASRHWARPSVRDIEIGIARARVKGHLRRPLNEVKTRPTKN